MTLPPGDALLLGRFDFVQALRALANLVENAKKYDRSDAPIEITAERVGGELAIRVSDRGPGVPPAERAAAVRAVSAAERAAAGRRECGAWAVDRAASRGGAGGRLATRRGGRRERIHARFAGRATKRRPRLCPQATDEPRGFTH